MTDYLLKADSLKKLFGRRLIFDNLSFNYSGNGIYGIAGANGSGKSTLVKIIAGLIAPSGGKIVHSKKGKVIEPEQLHDHIGFVSPYLVMYDEFTAEENLKLITDIRGMKYNKDYAEWLLEQFNILNRKSDQVKAYSSGMKQRLKFVFAFLHSPSLIILDEPTSNLDNAGKEAVYRLVNNESVNKIILVASNEENDLSLCRNIIELENYKLKQKERI